MHFTTDSKTDIIYGGRCMEVTIDKLIKDILLIMAEECALDAEDKKRLYKRIFGSESDGETYE